MGDWELIFKTKGKIFFTPHEDIKFLIKLFKKEGVKKILDLGCGSGRHTVILAKHGFDVYGMDTSPSGLEQTKKWLKEAKLKATLKKASCFAKFPYDDNFFDAIISIQVIHHARIKEIQYCISEIERVINPKGFVFITVAKLKRNKFRGMKNKMIAPRTYLPLDGHEKGVPHYIYNKTLLKKDFKNFKILKLYVDKANHYCLLGKLNLKQPR